MFGPPARLCFGGILILLAVSAAVAQDDGSSGRRRKAPPTKEEAREKFEATKRKALENLQKKLGPKIGIAPSADGTQPRSGGSGAAPGDSGGSGAGTILGGGVPVRTGDKMGEGIYRLTRNSNDSWTIPLFPLRSKSGILGPSEFPPEDYVLRHATESLAMGGTEFDGAGQFELALPLPLDIGEYRRLETLVWLRPQNLKIVESEVRTVQQDFTTFVYFKVRTEAEGAGAKNLYFVRGSWMMVPAHFAKRRTYIPSQVNPWAVDLQAEAARRAQIDIAAAKTVGVSPDDEKFQQCGRCAIDLRNVSEKRLLVVAGHYFSDEHIGPKVPIEVLHAWNMSLNGNIIVDGTGGDYVGPQGCNFFPTRIFPDCTTVNDPFSLNVGGGSVLKTTVNSMGFASMIARRIGKLSSSMKVFFDEPEGWGADWNWTDANRRQKISQMTRLFEREVAARQRINGTQ